VEVREAYCFICILLIPCLHLVITVLAYRRVKIRTDKSLRISTVNVFMPIRMPRYEKQCEKQNRLKPLYKQNRLTINNDRDTLTEQKSRLVA